MELICPTCKAIGLKSQLVSIFNGYATLGHSNDYIDENGQTHWHNPNFSINVYRCSNGHEFKHVKHNNCSVYGCGWSTGMTQMVAVDDFYQELGITNGIH